MFAVYAKEANLNNPLASVVVGERPAPVVPEGWVRVRVVEVAWVMLRSADGHENTSDAAEY